MYKRLVAATGWVAFCAVGFGPGLAHQSALATTQDAGSYRSQGKEQTKTPEPSEGESKAAMKVQSAPDVSAKLEAATEFIEKYPKSILRPKVAGYVAAEISKTADASQKITLFENLLTIFKEPTDADVIDPVLFDAYMKSTPPRVEDAFRIASSVTARRPDDLTSLTQICVLGVEEAKTGNLKYAQQSQQAAQRAIQLIESGKKPDDFDDAKWTEYQTKWLPVLYQSQGILAMTSGKKEEAWKHLQKAASLNPADPFNFVLLGSIANDDYQKLAEQHKNQAPGPLKDELLKQAQAKMDQVIDFYAHTVALSEGNPAFQKLHDQMLEDLRPYWKYRHGGSDAGLQEFIQKYKKP